MELYRIPVLYFTGILSCLVLNSVSGENLTTFYTINGKVKSVEVLKNSSAYHGASSGVNSSLFLHPNMVKYLNQSRILRTPRNHTMTGAATETPLGTHPSCMPPKDMIIRLHHKARLKCEGYDQRNSVPRPSWLRNDRLVKADSVSVNHYALDLATGDLLIANVTLKDAALWQCGMHDPKTGQFTAFLRPIHVIVIDLPKTPYLEVDGRRLDPTKQFLPLVEYSPLTVWCIADGGLSNTDITWHLSTSMPTLPLSVQPTLRISGTNGSYQQLRSETRISRVLREHHNATLTCSLHHEGLDEARNVSVRLEVQYDDVPPVPQSVAGFINFCVIKKKHMGCYKSTNRDVSSNRIFLNVLYSVVFVIIRWPDFGVPIRKGIPVSLKCDIDSNPPSKPIWLKDDDVPPVPQSGAGFINFCAIQKKHMGCYNCTNRDVSSNGIFLNVLYVAVLKKVVQDSNPEETSETERHIKVTAGGAVLQECPLTSPDCWGSAKSADLILKPVKQESDARPQEGVYEHIAHHRCVQETSPRLEMMSELDGDEDDQGELVAPAVYPPNTTLNVYAGQRVELRVEFCANPPPSRAFWLAGRLLMFPGESNTTFIAHNITAAKDPHCYIAALYLRKIRLKAAGEYVFVVRSPRGIAEGSIMINVTKARVYTGLVDGRNNMAPSNTFYRVAALSFLSMFLLKILVL